ncbi:DinB family protein [Desulfosporosinus sp. OT]|uniref:DinB family protein n=1 Tax=Desulfosporosinus sp. OT TaxID=913865 RepID=UPI000223A06A|nr:DinB family protein [Desulfosporosinus sp. OT]EGW37167.1 dinB family protein [Desulfosporosinus sp. OT]
MITKGQIIELYYYDEWANFKLLDAISHLENEELIRDLSSSFRSVRDTMVHILGAEELWLSRWRGEQGRTLLNANDFSTVDALTKRWGEFKKLLNSYLDSLKEENLMEEISYKNLKGIPYRLELWKQMLHVNNHSSYHRGQVVSMLRQLKKQPPSLDLINYYLENK